MNYQMSILDVCEEVDSIKAIDVKPTQTPITTLINKEFLIRVETKGVKGSRLYSAFPYFKLINNNDLVLRQFNEVLNNGLDKTTFKLRRGLTINFISR